MDFFILDYNPVLLNIVEQIDHVTPRGCANLFAMGLGRDKNALINPQYCGDKKFIEV